VALVQMPARKGRHQPSWSRPPSVSSGRASGAGGAGGRTVAMAPSVTRKMPPATEMDRAMAGCLSAAPAPRSIAATSTSSRRPCPIETRTPERHPHLRACITVAASIGPGRIAPVRPNVKPRMANTRQSSLTRFVPASSSRTGRRSRGATGPASDDRASIGSCRGSGQAVARACEAEGEGRFSARTHQSR